MNVTGVEWRDPDSYEPRLPARKRQRRPPTLEEATEEGDVVEIHGDSSDSPADGLDVFE